MLNKATIALTLPVLACTWGCTMGQKGVKAEEIKYKKHTLTREFVAEGVAVGDVNKDGKIDILAGSFWYEAPDWKQHELAPPLTFAVNTYGNAFLHFTMDVNQDGWIDYIRIDHPGEAAYWYENPQGKPGHWPMHLLHSSVGNESPLFEDVDGDGRPDIICNDSKTKEFIWLKAPSDKNQTQWEKYVISDNDTLATHKYTHGLGYADINGDGRKDVIITQGWWEAPADRKQKNWKFHPASFGEPCAQMYAHDFNGDGLVDLIASSAHSFGVWWYEQGKDASGNPTWTTHLIDKSLGQTHNLALTDVNGDGHPDLVTGKRFFAHNGNDPGEHDPPLLIWYEFIPGKTPTWKKHVLDDNSGAGLHLVVQDMNKDGKEDLVIGNKRGIFYFEREK